MLGGSVPESVQVGGIHITAAYLQQESSFLDDVTIQLYQRLVEIFGEELDQEITSDTILTTIKQLAENWLEEQQLWPELAQEIRSNLVMRSLQDMERDLGDSMLPSLDWEAFNRLLLQYLADGDSDRLQSRLSQLEAHHAQRLANRIVQALDLETQSIATLKRLLQISPDLQRPSAIVPDDSLASSGPIPQVPSEFPTTAQEDDTGTLHFSDRLQADLWEPDLRNIAFLRYQSKHHRNFYLEHYLLNPGDFDFLLWEMAEQLLNKCGNTALLMHLLLVIQMESHPTWQRTAHFSVEEFVSLLYPDAAKGQGQADLMNQTAGLAYALSCLLVKLVVGQEPGGTLLEVQTPVSKLWDILIQPAGELETATGRVDEPKTLGLTVRSGLWVEALLHATEGQFQAALSRFGKTMKRFYHMGGVTNPLALRLMIYLMLESRLQGRFSNPEEYQVRQLLMAVFPQAEPPETLSLGELQELFEQWNQALEMLAQLGWQTASDRSASGDAVPVFYLSPYPRWLDPTQAIRKPKGWVNNWLNQAIALYPPAITAETASS